MSGRTPYLSCVPHSPLSPLSSPLLSSPLLSPLSRVPVVPTLKKRKGQKKKLRGLTSRLLDFRYRIGGGDKEEERGGMVSSSPPLGLLLRPPTPAICLPPSSLALGPSASGVASQIPTFISSSMGSSLDSTRPHLSLRNLRSRTAWHCGYTRRDSNGGIQNIEDKDGAFTSGSSEENGVQVPTQAQSLVEGSGTVVVSEYKPIPDIDYLQELLAIQQQGPRAIGFFGTRNMGFMHQQLIEILSYAMVITKNHIFTSGASGTNAAVIRGALRAEKPELLTVILPQSLKMQPPESQELLSKVQNLIEKPQNDHLPLIEASRLCNMDILSKVQQVICFAFHDSKLLMETCQEAKNMRKIVTLFYLD